MTPKSAIHLLCAAAVCLCLPLGALAQSTSAVPHHAAAYGKVPLQFEENRGQARADTRFLSRGPGYSLLLRPTEMTLILHKADKHASHAANASTKAEVVNMRLAGANAQATLTPGQRLPGYVNYMVGPDRSKWKLGVPTYAEAQASDVYPGIGVRYYGTQRQVEYDFLVAPHADASLIRLSLSGVKPLVAPDGSLVLQAHGTQSRDDLRFEKPVIYQELEGKRQPVVGSFSIATNGEVGFQLGIYDHARALVIDPIISYAGYFGGSAEDEINGSALNASNQLYAVGQSFSTSLLGTAGEFETAPAANNNGHDAFVTKFSADGSSILWTTYLSGAGDDFATAVTVGASDQAYVVGYTASCGDGGLSYNTVGEFPFTADAVQGLCNPDVRGFNNYESNGAGYDAFLVKLSSDGKTELYGTPLGGTNNDLATGVVLDSAGKVYIVGETTSTGYTYSTDLSRFSDVPSYPSNNHGSAAIGIANYPTTSTAFYTNTTESKLNAVTSPNGSPGVPPGGSQGPTDEQAFITVLSADLHTIVYSSLIGGPVLGGAGNGTSATNGLAIAVNASNIAFIGGNTSSAHWPVTPGAIENTCANGGAANSTCNLNGWLAAFDATKSGAASLLFSTYITGQTGGVTSNGTTFYPSSDVFGLTTDSAGNVIATGDTNAVDFPTTSGTLQPSCFKFNDGNGNTNVCEFEGFVTKLSPAGAIVWSTFLGATAQDITPTNGRGVAVDASDNVYVLATSGSSFLPTKNAISATPGGGPDAYLAELSPTGSTLLMGTYLGAGGGISINNNSLHLDSNQIAYFSGYQGYNPYGGTSFPVSANAADKTLQSADGFVVKMITQQQPSATVLTVSPNPATPAQTVMLTASVTTSSTLTGTILPTGIVTFYSNATTAIGTATLNASGVATYSGTLAGGAYNITASYAGDAGFNPSVSAATPLTVSSAAATATTLTVAPATSTYGIADVFTATVKAGTVAATSGTVTFAAGNVTFGTATVNSAGLAILSVTPPVGVYAVIATYAGTYNAGTNPTGYAPSVSTSAPLTISKAASSVALTSSAAAVAAGASFTLTATVPAAATGMLTFYNGSTSAGTATISGGVATLTTSIATVGTYSFTAVYAGDTNYTGSTSTALTQTIGTPGFTVTASPSSLTVSRGSAATTTLTFTTQSGFTGAVSLSCGSLPAFATCSFSPANVTLGATPVTSALTFGTGTLSASLHPTERPGAKGNAVSYAALFGFLALAGLSRRRKLNASLLRLSLVALLLLTGVAGMTGCSGGNATAQNATAAGTYTVAVTIASASGTTQTVPLTVVVQ